MNKPSDINISFGTTNPYKVRELAAILNPIGINLSLTDPIDPEETGVTLQENARIKADAYSKHVGDKMACEFMTTRGCTEEDARTYLRLGRNWVICEDSGMCVPALNGLPGPWSARFDDCEFDVNGHLIKHDQSSRNREEIDAANNLKVLELMCGVEQPHRAASFDICLVVADTDGKILFESTRKTTGWVLEKLAGSKGFGYDPIFASDSSFGKSWAELDHMRKNLISHRRRVLQDFTAWLAAQIKGDR